MLGRLQEGDILILFDEPVVNANIHEFIKQAFHGTVYSAGNIYHATSGRIQSGVKSHSLLSYFKPEYPLGSCLIFRCYDPLLGQALAEIVTRWDPAKFRQKLKEERERGNSFLDENDHIKLPTAFSYFQDRSPDPESTRPFYELYRGFRAYMRNQPPADASDPVLSKNKGVSCGALVFYSFKAAFFQRFLFPEGKPDPSDPLIQLFEKIEGIKSDNQLTKLAQIDAFASSEKVFEAFRALVLERLCESRELTDWVKSILQNNEGLCGNIKKEIQYHHPEMKHLHDEDLIKGYINYTIIDDILAHPVKGHSINDFCRRVFTQPDMWGCPGYLCYKESQTNEKQPLLEPRVMSYLACSQLAPHSMTISDQEVGELAQKPAFK